MAGRPSIARCALITLAVLGVALAVYVGSFAALRLAKPEYIPTHRWAYRIYAVGYWPLRWLCAERPPGYVSERMVTGTFSSFNRDETTVFIDHQGVRWSNGTMTCTTSRYGALDMGVMIRDDHLTGLTVGDGIRMRVDRRLTGVGLHDVIICVGTVEERIPASR